MKARDRHFVDDVICSFEGQELRVANLSADGLFAVTNHPPPIGKIVILELLFGGRDRVQAVAEVTWLNEPSHPNLPLGFGVRFLRVAPVDKEVILEFIRRSDQVLGDPEKRS